jgi:hypothetical protein
MIASMHRISLEITVFIGVCTKGLCKAEAEGQIQIPAYHRACRVYQISNCRQPLHSGKPYIEQARSYLAPEAYSSLSLYDQSSPEYKQLDRLVFSSQTALQLGRILIGRLLVCGIVIEESVRSVRCD